MKLESVITGIEQDSQLIANENLDSADPWTLYLYAMKSPATKEKYLLRLGKFLDFLYPMHLHMTSQDKARIYSKEALRDSIWAFNGILKYIQSLKDRADRKEITGGTIRNYVKSIKLFCQMADIPITWDKITRGLPKGKRYTDDRAPTLEEIKRLCHYPDRRIKSIVYTMVSSGIRVGAWDYLRWGNIRPVEQNGKIVAAKMIVYAGEDGSYTTYINEPAFRELAEWMKYREESGESINEESWVMRDLWDTRVKICRGLVTLPKQLSAIGVKRLMERAIWAQGLRKELEAGKKRHPFAANHSLRKYFKTRCELAGMKPINIENLMGHSIGISESYYRPTENDLLQDYLKCTDALTISDERFLQSKVNDLIEKTKDTEYLVHMKHVAKLETERTQEIDLLKAELAKLRVENQESATAIDEHNLVLKNLNDNFRKQQAERDKQFRVEMNTKLYERNNDITELKAAVAFLADKVNAAIIVNEPSSKVIFNQKGIPAIKIPALNYNTATSPIAKITEENQESATTTFMRSNLKQSK